MNHRLNKDNIELLLNFTDGIYPLTREIANNICIGTDPVSTCTQVYGIINKETNELVSIMTATYMIVFPHEDGTRVVHISGAYTKDNYRHQGHASTLLKAIENDAKNYFRADYLCCDSKANKLYESNGFSVSTETRLWKQLI